ncbi:amidohydrolase [Cupriavidus sp. D384]|uniref:amidohydrolase family protein n=1 Tax=Cupriavidus sp. D384 TaxID=1538095 RepID=UPI0018D3325D|nr:amidohydrolase family protein [Cupriavidus sp. D384]
MPRSLDSLASWVSQLHEEPIEPELPIIDPHHHLFDDERGRFLAEELEAEIEAGTNIVGTVFVQYKSSYRKEGPEAFKPVGEVEFATSIGEACEGVGGRRARFCSGIIAHADLMLGSEVEPVLEAMIAAGKGRLKGIRHGATWDAGAAGFGRTFAPRYLMREAKFQGGIARLAHHGLTFDAWLFYHQLDDLVDLLERHPEVNVILDHCGGIVGLPPHLDRSSVLREWRAKLRRLAQFPNLSVKIGGLGMLYAGWDFHVRPTPPTSLELAEAWKPYVVECIDAFGPRRCMFESNFPVDKQSCSYTSLWNAFKRIAADFSVEEKRALFHDTAVRAYRLETDAGAGASA